MSRAVPVLIASLAVAAFIGGMTAWRHWSAPEAVPMAALPSVPPPAPVAPEIRPDFTLADTDGRLRDIAEWDGRVVVVNFWATWCPPCLEEIPAFVELQEAYGSARLQVIGIAIDTPDKVADFMDTTGINYPVLIGERDAIEVGRRFGNRLGALPYSAVIDRSGRVAHVHRGALTLEAMRDLVEPLVGPAS